MYNIAVFASGSGSNAENIIKYFLNSNKICVKVIFCNNSNAYVIERAKKLNVDCVVFNRINFNDPTYFLKILSDYHIDFIVLAGFLWMIPEYLIKGFPKKIINIHPALLPKYGGRGMYGDNVHKAVETNKENESGITIHFVNEKYDEGEIIFQAKCEITESDTYQDIARKVHELEYKYFPKILEKAILGQTPDN